MAFVPLSDSSLDISRRPRFLHDRRDIVKCCGYWCRIPKLRYEHLGCLMEESRGAS